MDRSARGSGRLGRVLVVEDEREVAELIRHTLTRDGHDVAVAATGPEALRAVRTAAPDLVVLDLMLPEMDGLEVCRRLKREPATAGIPVIMVTGCADEGDRVHGLEIGADDYVTKPFSPRELAARVRAVARRSRSVEGETPRRRLTAGGLAIDRDRFEVTMNDRAVELTPKEFELLAALVGVPGRVFRREELLDQVWGRDGFVEPRTVDVHLARLRRKFLSANLPAPTVETVRGIGYRFQEPVRRGRYGLVTRR